MYRGYLVIQKVTSYDRIRVYESEDDTEIGATFA
jgi:hypothetical protein